MSILVLGGTTEAHVVSAALGDRAVVSLAHQIESRDYASPVRRGGFGGEAAQVAWMITAGVHAVVDASHPFAQRISARTCAICQELSLPYLRLVRAPWIAEAGDHWTHVAGLRAVVDVVPVDAVALLTLGAQHLADLAGLKGRVILRSLMAVERPPFSEFEWLQAGPGSFDDEKRLMTEMGLTHLVCRNSGGARDGKLHAARALGVEVVMVDRPANPPGTRVETALEAIAWAQAQ